MQWVCSLWYSLQGPGALHSASPYPTNRLPLVSKTRPTTPVCQEAPLLHLQLFEISTANLCLQLIRLRFSQSQSQLSESINEPLSMQAILLWKARIFCGKRPHPRSPRTDRESLLAYPRTKNPRSVSPFTKNCIASATSSSPIMRTRMRIPVSPITDFTRPAAARIQ